MKTHDDVKLRYKKGNKINRKSKIKETQKHQCGRNSN
jgi:hypothetical protein